MGDGWIKTSLATSEFKPLVSHFQETNKNKAVKEMKFDVYENKVKDPFTGQDLKVSVVVEKSIAVGLGDSGNKVANYDLIDTIGTFVGQDIAGSFNKAEVSGGDLKMTDKTGEGKGAVGIGSDKKDVVTATDGGDRIDAGGGDDEVSGGKGADKVIGKGNDIIDGGTDDEKKKTDGARISGVIGLNTRVNLKILRLNKYLILTELSNITP